MIVTRNWLQEFIDISHLSTKTICKALNSIGLEVEGVEKFFIPNGVVVGYVLECIKHPDADKLNICQVDIGNETVQIVCGASNVAQGQYVPVATVGAVLGDDFKIKKAKLRGVESYGMICSTTEIGLPKLNDGILELDNSIGELKIGKELNEYSVLAFETIELELTANRGDCLSINGIARELSTYFNIPFYKQEYIIKSNKLAIGQILDVNCSGDINSNLVYKASDIKDFGLPLLQKLRMAIVGVTRNTDIETATAYATHATGVLLNVYSKAIANNNQNNEIVSLSIEKNKLGFDTVSGEILLSTIGVEAGYIIKLDDRMILEASYTAPDMLAQKVFDTKQPTGDIYYKSSRGSEADLSLGMDYLTDLLSKNGGTIYNGSEQYVEDIKEQNLSINISKINAIIGEDIPKDKIIGILTGLKFKVKDNGNDVMSITIPSFRHDIKNIADITEEIVRMIGIDNIQAKPLSLDEVNRVNFVSNRLKLSNDIRARAISNGFFETLTYVFSQRDLLEKYGFGVVEDKKDILNPIVKELNTFRTTLELNLIQAISHNVKQGFKSVALFESGTVFDTNRDETKKICFVFSGEKENETIKNTGKAQNIDFFDFAQKITNIIGEFDMQPLTNIDNNFIHPYQNGSILIDKKEIGSIYKLHPSVAYDFDISNDTFIAVVDFDKLLDETIIVTNISKYQASKRDLSIIAPKDMEFRAIKQVINGLNIKEIKQFNLVDIYSDEKLGDKESLTIRFVLQSETKTLEDEDITKIMDRILDTLGDKLEVGIR